MNTGTEVRLQALEARVTEAEHAIIELYELARMPFGWRLARLVKRFIEAVFRMTGGDR